ncbi:Citrate transporter [Beutenbergia cavernae DSM 12333]|uniref:Citrate transporter n=1 Tax=Beutenbergia cavernae (strain ATCC BAA-8 / DSM 12333 / CCUG 43141 / JCM 11478 / NBRC 16432 / NCIMB 13614 / HKI 0122) TaxID=471853 RepID=C5BVP4_BEUC1|nr:SLC13 family permease [Beutenbergia cavernae]ACQ78484.1 Citrate transporter [Beutenbergia cavernae DSM 12333]
MSDLVITLLVLAAAIALFVWNRISVGVVAVGVSLALLVTGVIGPETVLAGFGDPVVIFVGTLFVLAEGLEASGVTAWAGRVLVDRFGSSRARLLGAVMLLAAVLAALVTPNGAAAAIVPIVVVAARRLKEPSSQLLIPVAFAASAGALLTLSGSTVNVIVSDALLEETGEPFGFFEFALMGGPLIVVTLVVAALLGPRLLPRRAVDSIQADFSKHTATLVEHYRLDRGFYRLRVATGSPLTGSRVADVATPDDVTVLGVQVRTGDLADPDHELEPGDVVVVTGDSDRVRDLVRDLRLAVVMTPLTRRTREALLGKDVGLAEVVVRPRSRLVGRTVFPGAVRGDVTILGVLRLGTDRGAQPTRLAEGDAMLVHGTWQAVGALEDDDDLLVVDSPDLVRRQAVPLGPRAWRALAVIAATVTLLASGVTSPAIAGLAGAAAMVAFRVVTPQQAYRAVSWQVLVLLGGLIPLSVAITDSGLADAVADVVVGLVGGGSPLLLLAALFALTALLGQVVSNTATVLIVTPIALAAAAQTEVAAAPVLMLVAVAGASSFLTPIATPANMIVMAPGGYRFGDYWKLGIVTMVAWLAVALLLIPLIWPLS